MNLLNVVSNKKLEYGGIYRARVEDNNDPLGRGRVQVRVFPMMDGVAKEDLPWAEPCWNGFLKVPAVGSWVWVMFQEGEITSPVWLGWSVPFSESGVNYKGGERGSEYDKKEFIGKEIYVENSAEYPHAVIIRHRSGSKMVFYDSGRIHVESSGKAWMTLFENGRVHIESKGGARVVLYENGNVLIQGVRIDLNP